ncbi:MAG: hypothetical protein WCT31_02575 [Candidatus Micrarchaeia archaeon]
MTSDELPITLDALYGHVAGAIRVVIIEDCPENRTFLARAARRLSPDAEIIAVPDLKRFNEEAAGKVNSDTCILCDAYFPDDITGIGGPIFNAGPVLELARKAGAKFALTTASEPMDIEPAFLKFVVDKHGFIEGSKIHAGQLIAGILPITRDNVRNGISVLHNGPTLMYSVSGKQSPSTIIPPPKEIVPSPQFPARRFRTPGGAFGSGRKCPNLV